MRRVDHPHQYASRLFDRRRSHAPCAWRRWRICLFERPGDKECGESTIRINTRRGYSIEGAHMHRVLGADGEFAYLKDLAIRNAASRPSASIRVEAIRSKALTCTVCLAPMANLLI